MEISQLVQSYIAIGAGGIALVVVLWLLIYCITSIKPSLQSIQENDLVNSEILKNSTDAVKEVSRSNDNVANAIVLLNHSFDSLTSLFEKHDAKQDHMDMALLEMKSDLSAITRLVIDEKRNDLTK